MNQYRSLGIIARIVVVFFLVAFTASLIHLGISKNEALFKINSALIYPALVCLILLVCLIFDFKGDLGGGKKEKDNEYIEIRQEYRLVTILFLGLLVYILLLKYLILPFALFPLATTVYVTAATILLNDGDDRWMRKIASAALIAVVFVLAIYYSFSRIFGVILP